jgi:hypothetical protein
MKKLTLALFLIAAFCLVAVSPVVADASTNPANAGINSTSPFWFKDYTPSSGKTLAAVFTAPTYKPSSAKTLDLVFTASTYKPSSAKTLDLVFTAPTYKPSIAKTLATVFTVPALGSIKTSSGGNYYVPT